MTGNRVSPQGLASVRGRGYKDGEIFDNKRRQLFFLISIELQCVNIQRFDKILHQQDASALFNPCRNSTKKKLAAYPSAPETSIHTDAVLTIGLSGGPARHEPSVIGAKNNQGQFLGAQTFTQKWSDGFTKGIIYSKAHRGSLARVYLPVFADYARKSGFDLF